VERFKPKFCPTVDSSRNFVLQLDEESVLLTQYLSGDKIETNEMGRVCGTYGGEERRMQSFGDEI